MTTPRPHADKAILFYSDSSMRCWTRLPSMSGKWYENTSPAFDAINVDYYVGLHEPSRRIKVGSREINAPMDVTLEKGAQYWIFNWDGSVLIAEWDCLDCDNNALNHGNVWATEADATAARDAWRELMKGQV